MRKFGDATTEQSKGENHKYGALQMHQIRNRKENKTTRERVGGSKSVANEVAESSKRMDQGDELDGLLVNRIVFNSVGYLAKYRFLWLLIDAHCLYPDLRLSMTCHTLD